MTAATEYARNDTSNTEHNRDSQRSAYTHDPTNSGERINSVLYRIAAKWHWTGLEAKMPEAGINQNNPAGPWLTLEDQGPDFLQIYNNPADATECRRGFSSSVADSIQYSLDQLAKQPVLTRDRRALILRMQSGETIEIVPSISVSPSRPLTIDRGVSRSHISTALKILEPSGEQDWVTVELGQVPPRQPDPTDRNSLNFPDYIAAPRPVQSDSWGRIFASATTSASEVELEAFSKVGEIAGEQKRIIEGIVQTFAQGVRGKHPAPETVETARLIVEAASHRASAKEIEIDEDDGLLSFELRLESGLLVVGELTPDGNLEADVFDDQNPMDEASVKEIWLKHLPNTSVEDLVSWF